MVAPDPQAVAAALAADPALAPAVIARLELDDLSELGAVIAAELRERAVAAGDRDAILAEAFEAGFARDGLATHPWIEGPFVVCPGGLVGKNRANHKCRFVSVDGSWVWESHDLIHEEKRSAPGRDEGFRAVALLPVIEGMALDLVSGKMRSGQHGVERVVSFEVRRGALVEVGQRDVVPRSHGSLRGD